MVDTSQFALIDSKSERSKNLLKGFITSITESSPLKKMLYHRH